jgi:hypothetical protein
VVEILALFPLTPALSRRREREVIFILKSFLIANHAICFYGQVLQSSSNRRKVAALLGTE